MKILLLDYGRDLEKEEFIKLISFVSADIISFEERDHKIALQVQDNGDLEQIKFNFNRLMEKYCSPKESEYIYFQHKHSKKQKYYDTHSIYESDRIESFEKGLIGFKKEAVHLFNYFSSIFRTFAIEEHAEERIYPTLLPMEVYKKTGYLKSSPQYAMFCCDVLESMDSISALNELAGHSDVHHVLSEPSLALSPSACFHTYRELENQSLKTSQSLTFTQKVFRNEGRFNWNEFGRLRDYHVREIVFIGDAQYVLNQRNRIMDKVATLMQQLNLSGQIAAASDPFIIPDMQSYKKIQLFEKSKYELRLSTSEEKSLACASFNLHGISFTKAFHIEVENCSRTVTGCIGFGIERWVLAFMCQYGIHYEKWPAMVLESMK
ncbi:aminoacyl--tRNA ligase-related protein [Paenibacillus etheri]|uniref:Uncharacterized protein n=1 Tax=Paenibacillus etheri TaxID=1306852 RepID=A0A0W1AZI5_9BACL|nr:aminoacyl--tRNA ligase-related protein [Paenibacillus etheri]KTD86643.1 hypothetical protein UQ64_14395 [Paenibacillus etheri]